MVTEEEKKEKTEQKYKPGLYAHTHRYAVLYISRRRCEGKEEGAAVSFFL